MSTAIASATASAASAASTSPYNYRIVGVILAIGSGVLIGASFVFKKKGLIASQKGGPAGVGVAYLKSPLWWTGMTMMIVGELCNFGAYAFVEAIIVTPLGALSVVISAVLSSIFLNEKLSFFGWIGCFQCIVGSVIIALNGPEEQSASTINEFKHLFLAPGFLTFGSLVIAASLIIIIFIAPKYGTKTMLWYILTCSLIGGLSVSCTQGLGASIVTSVRGYNQFKNWFIYFLLAFVTVTLITEIYFLNVALALFNTAMVTPTYYVIFTFCTLVTSVILYQGVKASATQMITIVLGFLVICSGITILQMSKVDPKQLENVHNLDRKSALLIRVANQEVEKPGGAPADTTEDGTTRIEEPGVDALRGFNGLAGTIARARRRTTIISDGGSDHHHPDLGRMGSIFIPNFGLGRYNSTIGPGATSSRYSGRSPSQVENGLMPPTGHTLGKATTAPGVLGAPGSPGKGREDGDQPAGHIWSGRVPRATAAPPRNNVGGTHFWQRRTGSGSRKVDMSQHLGSANEEALAVSGPSTPGQHSMVEDTLREEEEGDQGVVAVDGVERTSTDRPRPNNTHEHSGNLRALLGRHHIEDKLHHLASTSDAPMSVPGSVHSHVSFAGSPRTAVKSSLSAEDADAPTVKGRPYEDPPRPRIPLFAAQDGSATSLDGGGGPVPRYFTPPETPSVDFEPLDYGSEGRSSGRLSALPMLSTQRATSTAPSITVASPEEDEPPWES
ncbi:hypothetical protein FRB94_009525 [Tulasnella sp. JGI-2019a]|nr:hypothetical protein FRB94_009525 [Tulasnella sp. JGI-2019a]KAG9007954.1 hypothetical protein FRB93_006973 [Tulasnella sp. JGI-2019a]KAG9025454.1 hypothetical protein FRB95_010137 [Tulasnella sp. JGI-2019a]